MKHSSTSRYWRHQHHQSKTTDGSMTISIGMIPLPPFDQFHASTKTRMTLDDEGLTVFVRVDNYTHLIFWIYVFKEDLYKKTTLPIDSSELPGTAYVAFQADKTYAGSTGQLQFSYDEKREEFTGTLHFDAMPYRFTEGTFTFEGLWSPEK